MNRPSILGTPILKASAVSAGWSGSVSTSLLLLLAGGLFMGMG